MALAASCLARGAGRTGGRTQRFTDEQILAAFAKARGNLTQAAKSMRYKVKGVTKTMTLQGFRKALERAQAAQSGDE